MPISGDLTVPPGNMAEGQPYEWNDLDFYSVLGQLAPGSPDWWLAAGIYAIQSKQEAFSIKEQWVFGPHPSPNGDKRYVRALEDLQKKTQTNYIQLATQGPIQRMRVNGIRFGSTKADPDARSIWMANDMDVQMDHFLMDAATYGEAYMLAGDIDPESNQPVITTENPRICHVFPDPVRPTRSLAGIRLWKDVFLNQIIAVVYLPERTFVYLGPKNSTASAELINSPGSYTPLTSSPNTLGEVPLVRAEWRPGCRAEAEDVYAVQDRINHTILDRLVISKSQAYNQKFGTGVTLSKKQKQSSRPPFEEGANQIWLSENPDAAFGQFEAADIRQLLEAIRDDVIDIAALTQTPAHYLMGKMNNVSGDTLTQAESGFVAKIKMRCRSVGWTIERVMRMAFKFKGLLDKALLEDAEVIWADPEVRSRAETADASLKEAQVFASCPPFAIAVIAERMGYDPDQIEELVVAAEEWQQQQLEREEAMMDKQNEGAIAVAKEGGRARPAQATKSQSSSGSSTTK